MTWTENLPDDKRATLLAAVDTHGADHLRYAGGDRDFAAYLLAADIVCRRRRGLSIFDLADYSWRDAYDDELTPTQAAREAITADDL